MPEPPHPGLAAVRQESARRLSQRRETFHHTDPATGALPLWRKALYGLPQLSMMSATLLITVHGTIFFMSIGARVAFIGFFTALARSFDVITDPLMAYISDNTKTRHGRRRPFMFVGCWGYALFYVLLFSPPVALGELGIAVWFGAFYLIFYLFDTLTNVPYGALGPELSCDSTERSSLFFFVGFF